MKFARNRQSRRPSWYKYLILLIFGLIITSADYSSPLAYSASASNQYFSKPSDNISSKAEQNTLLVHTPGFPVQHTFGGSVDSVTAVAVGDMDGDTDLDIVAVNDISITANPKKNFVHLNDGKGNFNVTKPFGSSSELSTSVALGDIDADGDLDVVVGNYVTQQTLYQRSTIYINDGKGNLQDSRVFGNPQDHTYSVALGDMNGDGYIDIVSGNFGQLSMVYLNNGAGNFSNGLPFGDPTNQTYYVALGDLNGDGSLDIILADVYQNSFYLNDGQGNFRTNHTLGQPSDATFSLAVGDIDNDSDLDIVTSNALRNVIYLNDGTGNFPDAHELGTGLDRGLIVALGDIDSDGDLDIALGNQGQQNILFINDGSGNFPTVDQLLFGTGSDQTNSIAIADMDANGHLDLVVGNGREPSFVYFNNGAGAIVGRDLVGTTAYDTRSIATGDIDGDGSVDIIAGNNGQPNIVYLNDGSGSYTFEGVTCGLTVRTRCFGTGTDSTYAVAVADVEGDGDLDIIVGNMNEQNAIYLNDGFGNFYFGTGPVPCAVTTQVRCFGTGSSETWGLAVGDMNGDNRVDVVTAAGASQNAIYLNDGVGHFTTVNLFGPTANGGTISIALGDVNGDGARDIIDGNTHQNAVYLNNGSGQFYNSAKSCDIVNVLRCFGRVDDITTSVAVADLDGDGDNDVVAGNLGLSAVYLNDGSFEFAVARPFGTGSDDTSTVSLGDVDGDGDLDIALSVHGAAGAGGQLRKSAIYFNGGGATFHSGPVTCGNTLGVICFGNPTNTESVAFSDVNRDQQLDIIAGNSFQQSAVYLNQGSTFSTGFNFCEIAGDVRCFGSAPERSWSVATGDVDGDGDLDLVVGNYAQQSYIYLNQGSGEFINGQVRCDDVAKVRCFGDVIGLTLGIALGDVDGDGDLDIVTANDEQASLQQSDLIYLNDGTGHFGASHAFGPGSDSTRSVALGDLDGDGNLDIVIGNDQSQSAAYLNDGQGNFTIQRLFGSPIASTFSVALGDVDGDGDLDIAAGNYLEQNAIYLNDGLGNFANGSTLCGVNHRVQCFGTGSDPTSSVAFGDIDGNGAPDLVVGNTGQSAVYLNDGTGSFSVGHNFGSGTEKTNTVALGDIDNDGDIDIAVGNISVGNIEKNQDVVYINDGAANFTSSRSFGVNDNTRSLAFGDLDSDGDLDIASSSTNQQSAVYLNKLIRSSSLPNNSPAITLFRPGPTPDANFYSTPIVLDKQVIPVQYTLSDPEGDPVRVISATYSLDGGGNWRTAVPTNTVTTDLAASPAGTTHTFNWDTFASGFFGQSDNVVFRIVAYPSVRPQQNGVAGPYQRPYASATTFPFRVRGTQVQVTENGVPVANAQVYRRTSAQGSTFQPVVPSANAAPYTTDSQGYLRGFGQIGLGDQLIAMRPIAVTDALSGTYTLFHTNITPTSTGVSGFTVDTPGVQKIEVSAAHPLALFPLDISLEWDAHNDQRFMNQLQSDLQRTSEFLFDATNGQAALGEVRIFQNKLWWDAVNLRIYASNRLRPNSVVGGMTTQPITDAVSLRPNNPIEPPVVYGPGQLRMGGVEPLWQRRQ